MSAKDTGGSAFPSYSAISGCDEGGMTLRDFFAAKAMQAALTNPEIGDQFARAMDAGKADEGMAVLGKVAYAIADSMLAARNTEES